MYYYQIQNHTEQEPKTDNAVIVSPAPLAYDTLSLVSEQAAQQADRLFYLNEKLNENISEKDAHRKTVYCISHPAYFAGEDEGLWCLDTAQMDEIALTLQDIPQWLTEKAYEGTICGITSIERAVLSAQQSVRYADKKRVHIIAMGDVGGTMLIGLTLLGGDVIDTIGIYDFNENLCARWEHEINQIAYPWQYDKLPSVEVISQAQLFDCDVFIFCASKSIPAVGEEGQDVRMAQLAANSEIIAQYGRMAREAEFAGLFAVVSDPVDLLCQRVYAASNRDASGIWDGKGLRPEQVQGYGLGVMNSRAAYYAKKEERFAQFLTEGRAYGPHGSKLVIADSVAQYNHALSLELTQKTVEANLEVRSLGYKPYIAPALSSAAISILLTLRGEWHYSANYLGGIYMGCKNRTTACGLELEHLPLPDLLMERIKAAEEELNLYKK